MRILFLGSKEYPLGVNEGEDPAPSGGMEVDVQNLVDGLSKNPELTIIVVTRRFKNKGKIPNNIFVSRVYWLRGFYLRNISFNFFSFIRSLNLNFDIICSHSWISSFFGIILGKLKNKKVICIPAGVMYTQPQYKSFSSLIKILETFVYKNVNFVLFLASEDERLSFNRKIGLIPENSKLIPLGINLNSYSFPEPYAERSDKSILKLIFVGRLIEVKGVEYLLRAICKVSSKYDFCLFIIGDGPQMNELVALSQELGIEHRVRFLGYKTNVTVAFEQGDIFLLPSLSEGLPTALLEAMASRCACVVTDIGLPVIHDNTGLIIPPKDVDALVTAIESLLSNKSLRRELGSNAHSYVSENHNINNSVSDFYDYFRSVVD